MSNLHLFATSGEIRGIGVLKTDTLQEAEELLATDPMVKAERLDGGEEYPGEERLLV